MARSSTRPTPARVTIRLDLASGRVGPGKIALLDAIDREGSISGAARAAGHVLSARLGAGGGAGRHRRRSGGHPRPGGRKGGGAALTEVGRALIARYRAVEAAAQGEAGPPPKALKG